MAPAPRWIHLLNSAQRRLQALTLQAQECMARTDAPAPSPAQGGVLFVLHGHDGATMGELAQALQLVPSAVSGLVQRMEALAWVRRAPCDVDARTQRVWLQPPGAAQLPALRKATARIQAELTQGFSADELATVARWLRHVQQLGHEPSSGTTP